MKTFTKMSLIAALACSAAAVVNAQDAALPTYDPPVPTYPAEDVSPIFCETYGTSVELVDLTKEWGGVSQWAYAGTVSGNTGVLQLIGMDQEGPVDADDPEGTMYEWLAMTINPGPATKDYTYLHVDVWCEEETDFRIGLHTYYVPSTGSALECYFPAIESESMEPGKWYSIDFPLTELKYTQAENQPTASWEGAQASVLRFGNGPDLFDYAHIIYAANIYLFNGEPACLGGKIIEPETGVDMVEQNNFRAFVSNEELTCSANETIEALNVYSVTGQLVKSVAAGQQSLHLNVADLTDGLYVVAAQLANGQKATLRVVK